MHFCNAWLHTTTRSSHTNKHMRQVLDIASMALLLTALDCQYFDTPDPAQQYRNQEFPDVGG